MTTNKGSNSGFQDARKCSRIARIREKKRDNKKSNKLLGMKSDNKCHPSFRK